MSVGAESRSGAMKIKASVLIVELVGRRKNLHLAVLSIVIMLIAARAS